VRRVADLIARSREPAIVFTEFRDSLVALVATLERAGAVSALHGGQSMTERRTALAAYLDGPATVLVATDVAGQGLNLQTRGRWVVNFDLPWNPARLAQRAGRVDRIGQTRPVHVTLLSIRHAAESDLVRRVSARAMRAGSALDLDLDTFASPDERTIGEAVVTGGEPASSRAPLIDVDVTWRRQARWAARDIVRRRLWARQWRETGDAARQPVVARARGACQGAKAAAWVLVFTTPITNATGTVLDRSIAVYRVWTSSAGAPARPVADLVRRHAIRRAERRAVRVRHWLDRRDRRAAPRDRAIDRELEAARLARLAQPGLFDRPPSADSTQRATQIAHDAWPSSTVFVGRAVLVAAIAVDR
jgi:hypothetical protein